MATARIFNIKDSETADGLVALLQSKGLSLRHGANKVRFTHHEDGFKRTAVTFSNKKTLKKALSLNYKEDKEGGFGTHSSAMLVGDGIDGFTCFSEGSTVDIVAIHGIEEHAFDAWEYNGNKGGGFMWLRDCLPENIPGARIMIFSYPAGNDVRSISESWIRICAESFLWKLLFNRRLFQASERPLVLLAHGTGGLIVKRALVSAYFWEDHTFISILNSLRGVMLFGTPHNPRHDVKLVKSSSRFMRAFGTHVRIKTLDSNRLGLSDLSESFSRLAKDKKICIVTFYEGKKTRVGPFKSIFVVDKDSAACGAPREHVEIMDADYTRLCKFSGPGYTSGSFIQVVRFLKMLCEE